ncbi:hypothetical protein LBWT_Y0040 (plasmid) [Leptolyngbya boryana IAM M-101]|nr:hypothetical protein LBWT_Y0040 [Leptolyngbya boryana IAM M-101]BAS66764.1 hypothetical protein LBDG_Y0040 [Leptolyngbya boryana dg5]
MRRVPKQTDRKESDKTSADSNCLQLLKQQFSDSGMKNLRNVENCYVLLKA